MAYTSLPKSIKILAASMHDPVQRKEFIRSYIKIAESQARNRSSRNKKDEK